MARTSEDNFYILSEIQRQLAIQDERQRSLSSAVEKLTEDLEEIGEEVKEMRAMANRWKGGFLVLAGLGGLIGWILSTWSGLIGLISSALKSS